MNGRFHKAAKRMEGFAIEYIQAPKYPQIERFIYTKRRTIYINLSARKDAKIIKLEQ